MADIDDLMNDINTTSTKKGKGKHKPKGKQTNDPAPDIAEEPKIVVAKVEEKIPEKVQEKPVKQQELAKEEKKEEPAKEEDGDDDGKEEVPKEEEAAKDGDKKKKVVVKKVVKKVVKGKDKEKELFLKLAQQQALLNKQLEDEAKKQAEEEEKRRKIEAERIRIEEEIKKKKEDEEEAEKQRIKKICSDQGISMKKYLEMKQKEKETLEKLGGLSIDDLIKPVQMPKIHKKKHQVTNKTEKNENAAENNETEQTNQTKEDKNIQETKDNKDVDDWETELDDENKDHSNQAQKNRLDNESTELIKASKLEKKVESDEEKEEAEEKRLRKPIICVLGHVDTGKTKILDKIRRTNVQLGEVGGITQQIGATNFPLENIIDYLKDVPDDFRLVPNNVPGFLIIDTPGHESFQNLRTRGQSLCDLGIIVIDIMHGLERQTIDSLKMLKEKRTPFLIALNKIDRLFDWKPKEWSAFQATFNTQKDHTKYEFRDRLEKVKIQIIKEIGLNTALFTENPNMKEYVNIVPTSAISGEGIPDLMNMFLYMGQKYMSKKLTVKKKIECSVLEVKVLESVGTTIDVVLVNGTLKIGDKIIVAGIHGPIKTHIKYLMTPQPMKELRIKSEYVHHKEIEGSIGVKIFAVGLEGALAGSPLYVYKNDVDAKELCEEIDKECKSIMENFISKSGQGVLVTASSLGALEAILSFLDSEDHKEGKVPVAAVSLGYVQKKDVQRILTIHNKDKDKVKHINKEEYCILAFDVHVNKDAQELADKNGVTIITAETIYHLKSRYIEFEEKCFDDRKKEKMKEAIFPCSMKIVPKGVFHKHEPIIVGVDVEEGILKIGTPLYDVDTKKLLGVVEGIEKNGKPINDVTKKDGSVAIRIKSAHSNVSHKTHYDEGDNLISQISRLSIDRMKEYFYEELEKNNEYIELIKRFKVILDIR